MARMPRFFLPHTPLHVIVRGNNRNAIVSDDGDRQFIRECIRRGALKQSVHVHAYVIMTNHFHLVATPTTTQSMPRMMQAVGTTYVRYYNAKHARTGTLWEGRYKAAIIDQERYLLMCMRYVELNPVRASIVEAPQDYRWSSFRCNGLGLKDPVISAPPLYLGLGDDMPSRCAVYRAATGMTLRPRDLANIRDATQNAWALGGDTFIRRVDMLTRRGRRLTLGRPRKCDTGKEVESDPTY